MSRQLTLQLSSVTILGTVLKKRPEPTSERPYLKMCAFDTLSLPPDRNGKLVFETLVRFVFKGFSAKGLAAATILAYTKTPKKKFYLEK